MKNKITVTVFCALIAVITVASMVNPVREYSETENRPLAQMPEFSFKALFDGDFTADYETFITDQFVARDMWITLKTYAELALGKKDTGGVYFCDDGYLIEKHEPDDAQTEKNLEALKSFTELLGGDYNIRTLIAPTASLIHADKLPNFAPVWDQSGLLDRMAEIDGFVDVREVLEAHRDDYIYYRADHHWTTYGSYLAYTALCASLGITPLDEPAREILSEEFVGTLAAKVNVETIPDTLFTYDTGVSVTVEHNMSGTTTDTIYDRTKLEIRDKYSVFLGGNQSITDIRTDVKNGRTLMLIKDSYSHCMLPLLLSHYERVILIDLRHYNMSLLSYLEELEAAGDKVDDIVILYNAENFTEDRYLVKLGR